MFDVREARIHTTTVNTMESWLAWQREKSMRLLDQSKSDTPLFEDHNMILLKGGKTMPLLPIHTGSSYLFIDRIEFHTLRKEVLTFPIGKIYGENVQQNDKFDFFLDGALFRIFQPGKRVSAYKYELLCLMLRKKREEAHSLSGQ